MRYCGPALGCNWSREYQLSETALLGCVDPSAARYLEFLCCMTKDNQL